MLEKLKGAIKNGQSRDSTIGHKTMSEDEKKKEKKKKRNTGI